MRDVETLIHGIMNKSIAIKDLTDAEMNAVIDDLVDFGESLLDTENHDAGVAILEALDQFIDMRGQDLQTGFEDAIITAEQRGSTYWEIENPSIH